MPVYDSNGNLKTSAGTRLEIQASGSIVTTSASLINISGSGGIYASITNQGVNGVFIDISSSISAGDVAGPASATDNAVTRFDGTTGKVLQNSSVIIDDFGNLYTSASLSASYIDFPSGSRPPWREGRIFYDVREKALGFYNDASAVTQQIGQEGFIRVYNGTGTTIANGKPVYSAGVQFEGLVARPSVELAVASDRAKSRVIGVTTEEIADGAFGYLAHWGFVNDMDLSAFSNGDVVFLSETTPGGFRTSTPPAGNWNVQLGIVIDNDATTGRLLVYTEVDQSQRQAPAVQAVTGLIDGGDMTVSGSTFFNVTSGSGVVVDISNINTPTVNYVSWSAFVSQSVTNLASSSFTWIGINSSSQLVQISDRAPSPIEIRDKIWLGRIGHPNKTTLVVAADRPIGIAQIPLTSIDLARALGPFNVEGNVFAPSGSSLVLQRTSGSVFLIGSNYQNEKKQPSLSELGPDPDVTFSYRYRSGSTWISSASINAVDPTRYDNNGVLTTISPANSRWTVQRIQLSATGGTVLYYGQILYSSYAEALENVNTPIEVDPALGETITRGWVIVRGNATNLANTGVNAVVNAGNGPGTAQVAASVGITDHGALSGLSDDDHTQYLHVSGTRAMAGNLNMGSFNIIVSGTVDGRDPSVDGAKLDTIDAGAQVIAILSGSTGEIVTSSIDFINFTGPGIESVVISGSGVTVTTITGSGGGGGNVAIASGSAGTIIDSAATFINFEGNAVEVAEVSGSGVSLTFSKNDVKGFRGFSTSSYWSIPIAGTDLSGSTAGFELVCAAIPNRILGETSTYRVLAGNTYEFFGDGFEVGFNGTRPRYNVQGGGSRFENFTPNWQTSNPVSKPLLLLSFAWDGSSRILKSGGYTISTAAMATFDPNTVLPFVIGKNAQNAVNSADDCTIVSVAFKSDGTLDVHEWEEILRYFGENGDLPDSSFTSRWSAADLPTGSAPATLPDKIGTNHLTLSGTLEVVRDGYFTVPGFVGWASTASELSTDAFADISSGNVQTALEAVRNASGPLEILSGSGTQVTSSAYFINFEGTAVRTVEVTGSGVSVHIDHRPLIDFLTGFGEGATDADINAWQMSFDPLSGSVNWCVGVIFTRDNWDGGEDEQRIWSTSNQFLAGGGATFAFTETVPTVYSVDSAATLNTATGTGDNSFRSRAIFATVRHDDGLVTIDTNGFYTNGFSSGNAGAYQASGYPFTVGASGQPLNINGAEGWGIHAIGYVTRSVSRTEVLEWWHNVYSSGTMTDIPNTPGNGLNGAWRVVGGVNPSGTTWSPFIGADNLVKTGSKAHATSSIPLYW